MSLLYDVLGRVCITFELNPNAKLSTQNMCQQSAVVLALVATNPAAETEVPSEQEIRDHANEISSHDQKRAASISAFHQQEKKDYDEMNRKSASWSDDEYRRRRMQFNVKKSQERSQLLQSVKEKHNFDKIKLKTTVILTSVSLMGQWLVDCLGLY